MRKNSLLALCHISNATLNIRSIAMMKAVRCLEGNGCSGRETTDTCSGALLQEVLNGFNGSLITGTHTPNLNDACRHYGNYHYLEN